jgi:D-beta-D-heptose 7-phosphate kinase/D-beta-D-heptose 1-phosphate adenosyltransferase
MRSPAEVLAALDAPRLLVVGDLVLDRYLTGVVDRISPEAPIQVLRVEQETERLGGAGSVALNVCVLGAATTLVAVVGEDAAAGRLRALAQDGGVRLRTVVDPARRTGVKTRHLARSHSTDQQVLRVDEETVGPLPPDCAQALRRLIEAEMAEADAVLLSDYGKGALGDDLLADVIGMGNDLEIPVLVDPKGANFTRYRGATAMTPNRPEAAAATGIAVADTAGAERAARRLIEDLELSFVTLDREGMFLLERGGDGVHLPTTPREVFDVTGAGDMVISVLGMALAAGASPQEAAMLANVAAGLEVEHVGVVPISREEIAARLAAGGDGSKRVDRAELAALVARHRAARKRIVFTNGCFDILHAGHVRYLAEAKSHGDVLIVGVNDDESVRRIKGCERPINTLDDRIEVLAALGVVDHVVAFSEDVPTPLVAIVRPDVLVKGMDWAERGVEGREIVEAAGGRVVLVDLHEGRSTSGLVERIRAAGN